MWPVQTLTLLLCLTDEEQLFATRLPEPAPVVVEQEAPAEPEEALEVTITAEEVG